MKLSIHHQDEMRFVAVSGAHQVVADLPIPHGGTDEGMTPPQLFIASIGTCIGVYIVDYCERMGLEYQNLGIHLDWVQQMEPKRIKRIRIHIDLPSQTLDAVARQGLLEAANACMLHNTLIQKPDIEVHLPETALEELAS